MRTKVIRSLPNILSALRFPLGAAFGVMLVLRLSGERPIPLWACLICFGAICLTDLLDGKIARRAGAASIAGTVLDVTADSFYILLSLTILSLYGIVPVWFTGLVLIKLADFVITSRIFAPLHSERCFIFDFTGRFAAAGFFLLPGVAISLPGRAFLLSVILCALALAAAVSTALRWISFAKAVRARRGGAVV